MNPYDHKTIEQKWRKFWEEHKTYQTADASDKPKQFVLDMFPYPSGVGLHVGHPRGYIATDVYSRMKRMMGFNVLHPMGWDAFGLPAENFAIKNKIHPRAAVEKNIQSFKDQLSVIGFDYDWSREINTTDPGFYAWTQWTFIQMFKRGLAYQSFEPINWCPFCKTGLANEDIEADGTCEICKTPVEKKPMRQWVLKITDYADRMLADLDKLPKWPEGVKEAQRHWIGKSEGSEIEFALAGSDEKINIFTTRADTLFGVTYVVLAPEHPLIQALDTKINNYQEVVNYINSVKEKSDIDRTNAKKEKTGVCLQGVFAINPANNEQIPVWVADYVLANHGTGAVMAVPAHDERDFEFANKFNLPIKQVVVPVNRYKSIAVASTLDNADEFKNNLQEKGISFTLATSTISGREHICVEFGSEQLENFIALVQGSIKEGNWVEILGTENIVVLKNETHNDLLDRADHWFARFAEWEPNIKGQKNFWDMIGKNPFLNEFICYRGEGVLRNSGDFNGYTSDDAKKKITEFVGGKMVTNYRMKDWVFSRQRYWGEPIPMIHCEACGPVPVPESQLPVTLPEVAHYEPTGTGESPLAAIDEWVNVPCPTCGAAAKRETNTMPQWAGSSWYYLRYIDPKNNNALIDSAKEQHWMPVDVYAGADHATRHLIYARFWHKFLFDIGTVSTDEPFPRLEFLGYILAENGKKFSKRDGNGIDPVDVVNQFGADAFRLYEMFIGPFEQTAKWDPNGMVGTYRFIEKVWRIATKIQDTSTKIQTDESIRKMLHKTIKKVSEDIEGFKFNTAVSSLMIMANEMDATESVNPEDFVTFLKILAPFAPHVTEELWSSFGETSSVHLAEWPKYDPALVVDNTITLGVQVNGKVRAEIVLGLDEDEHSVKEKVMAIPEVVKWLEGKYIKKFIYVPGKIVSIVI